LDKDLVKYFENIELNGSTSAQEIDIVEKDMGLQFPIDYRQFIMNYNGGEGSIGSNSYIVLWSLNDITELNEAYEVNLFAPGLLLFGTDGANNAYAYDMRSVEKIIVEVPFIGMDLDEITMCAENLIEFLDYLYRK